MKGAAATSPTVAAGVQGLLVPHAAFAAGDTPVDDGATGNSTAASIGTNGSSGTQGAAALAATVFWQAW